MFGESPECEMSEELLFFIESYCPDNHVYLSPKAFSILNELITNFKNRIAELEKQPENFRSQLSE